MVELELSIMAPVVARTPDPITTLRTLLAEFEEEYHIQVKVNVLPWATGWAELVKGALFGQGPDISEIGTTWTSSFIGMNALLPLTSKDLEAVGGPSAYLPQIWQSGSLAGEKQMWGIPWLSGVRVLFYRRDLLAKAGVDERTAFQTHHQLEETLACLQERGIPNPWAVPTTNTLSTLHNIANWVFGAGGDFITPDGKQPLFIKEAACTGIRQYFELNRYLPQPARELDDYRTGDLFWEKGQAAVTMLGSWMLYAFEPLAASHVVANLGVALAPGLPFIGGSNLVVWKHSRHKEATLALLHFLAQSKVQIKYSQRVGLLPAGIAALADPIFNEGPLNPVIKRGVEIGRGYPVTLMWGLVEERLNTVLAQIWTEVLQNPQLQLDKVICQNIEPVAHSLSFALRSSGESQRRVRELQLLQNVSLAASSGLRLEDSLQAAAEALSSQLEGALVALLLLDDECKTLYLKANAGYTPNEIEEFYLERSDDIIGWLSKNSESIPLPQLRQKTHYTVGTSLNSTEICIPLFTNSQAVGILVVESLFINAFTDDDQRLLSTLANNLAILIERTRLFEEVENAKIELEQRADKLTRQAQELARSNSELEQFAYVASHDLQEPLRKVQAFGNQLQTKYSHVLDVQGLDYLERMQKAAHRMQAMITDLLTLSRVTTQAHPSVAVNLTEVVKEAVSDLEIRIEKTGGQVEFGELPTIQADPIQIHQLFANLIGNALKFHHPGIPPIVKVYGELKPDSTELKGDFETVETMGSDGWCRIFIEDNGIGFEEKYLDRIFQPFQRLHGRDEYEGSGMGLAICRKIIERHRGEITARSAPGQGTTFIITLPVR